MNFWKIVHFYIVFHCDLVCALRMPSKLLHSTSTLSHGDREQKFETVPLFSPNLFHWGWAVRVKNSVSIIQTPRQTFLIQYQMHCPGGWRWLGGCLDFKGVFHKKYNIQTVVTRATMGKKLHTERAHSTWAQTQNICFI